MYPVATTILEQMGGAGRIHVMTGATIVIRPDGVSFKLKRGAKVNYVSVTYNEGMDLYDMRFSNWRSTRETVKAEVFGVYASDLKRIFEQQTGLYLSL